LPEHVSYAGVIFGSQIGLAEHIQRFKVIRLGAMGRLKIMRCHLIAIERECVQSGKLEYLEGRRLSG
jgi:hypothetical protein